MSFIGQRLNETAALPGEVITVPDATIATIRDNRPIDAEIAMVLHNNAAHEAAEAVRPLAWWEGNLALPQTDSWVGLVDASRPDGAEMQTAEWEISWNSGRISLRSTVKPSRAASRSKAAAMPLSQSISVP